MLRSLRAPRHRRPRPASGIRQAGIIQAAAQGQPTGIIAKSLAGSRLTAYARIYRVNPMLSQVEYLRAAIELAKARPLDRGRMMAW
jgi:regulator of protease activity HflC (stomatin/prohibitin superfamily)